MGGLTDRWQSPGGLENRHACVARSFQFSLLRQVTEVVSALWHVFLLYIVFNFVRIMGGGRRLTQMLRYDKKVERTPDGSRALSPSMAIPPAVECTASGMAASATVLAAGSGCAVALVRSRWVFRYSFHLIFRGLTN